MTLALQLIAVGLSSLFPMQLPLNLPQLGFVLISLAIAAIPAGSIAIQLNNRKTMMLGLGLTASSLVLSVFGVNLVGANQWLAIAASVGLGLALSLVVNGILPLILSSVPSRNAGFATGTFFSGVVVATLVAAWFFERVGSFSPLVWLSGAIAALAVSGGCIVMSRVAVQSLKPTRDYQSS
jgi:MFS family permease